jgi:Meiotically up-regulated gene 113
MTESLIKVGVSNHPESRAKNLGFCSPWPVCLIQTWAHDRSVLAERVAHRLLRPFLLRGEWFSTNVEEGRQAIEKAMRLVDSEVLDDQKFVEFCRKSPRPHSKIPNDVHKIAKDVQLMGARVSADKKKAIAAAGVEKIKRYWGLSGEEWPTLLLRQMAGTPTQPMAYNTIIEHIGMGRSVARKLHQEVEASYEEIKHERDRGVARLHTRDE